MEAALSGLQLHALIRRACGAHVPIGAVLQGTQCVHTRQLHLVPHLVVALRERLRLHVAGKYTATTLVDVHHRVTARRAEEVSHVVAAQQPHARLAHQQHVEAVVHLRTRLHRILAPADVASLATYLHLLRAVAVGQYLHLHLHVSLVTVTSVYIHICFFTFFTFLHFNQILMFDRRRICRVSLAATSTMSLPLILPNTLPAFTPPAPPAISPVSTSVFTIGCILPLAMAKS